MPAMAIKPWDSCTQHVQSPDGFCKNGRSHFSPFLSISYAFLSIHSWYFMVHGDWWLVAICQVAHRQQDTQQGPLKVDRMGVSLEALMTGVIQPLKELVITGDDLWSFLVCYDIFIVSYTNWLIYPNMEVSQVLGTPNHPSHWTMT